MSAAAPLRIPPKKPATCGHGERKRERSWFVWDKQKTRTPASPTVISLAFGQGETSKPPKGNLGTLEDESM